MVTWALAFGPSDKCASTGVRGASTCKERMEKGEMDME